MFIIITVGILSALMSCVLIYFFEYMLVMVLDKDNFSEGDQVVS